MSSPFSFAIFLMKAGLREKKRKEKKLNRKRKENNDLQLI